MVAGDWKVKMSGTGAVTPPATPQRTSYEYHYQEFLRRGFSAEDADRLAREVVARDNPQQE